MTPPPYCVAYFGYTRVGAALRKPEDLLREAELALHESRRTRSGPSWSAYNERVDAMAKERVALSRELRVALAKGEFALHFQPKVALATGAVVSAEALLRWANPHRSMLPPSKFVPVAEQSQLIAPIGEWVVRCACHYLLQWHDDGFQHLRVAVNVSPVQLAVGDFTTVVRNALDSFDVPASALVLEITESVFEHRTEELRQQLQALHELGVRLLLDDFGTGYSSLRYLQLYPFDEIKIDQSFVRSMRGDRYSQQIVTTVMAMANALGADIVAEGIEDAETREALIAQGCPYGQGFYYGPAMAAEDFQSLLVSGSRLPLTASQAD